MLKCYLAARMRHLEFRAVYVAARQAIDAEHSALRAASDTGG